MNMLKYMCHRKPERSFFYKGHQFPVCARCTGGYLGLFLAVVWYMFVLMPYDISMFYLALILVIPAGIDGGTQYLEYRESNNTLRLITGILLGIGIVVFCKTLKHKLLF